MYASVCVRRGTGENNAPVAKFSAALLFVTKGCTLGCSRMNPCTSSPPQMPRGAGSVDNSALESHGLQLLEMAGKEDYEELRELLQSWDVADLLPHLQGMYVCMYVCTYVQHVNKPKQKRR